MIPEHQSMQVQQPHQMSKMEQVLLVGINLDHRLEHHQHLSIPVQGTEMNHFILSSFSLQANIYTSIYIRNMKSKGYLHFL